MNENICNICGANYEYKNGKWICPACDNIKQEEITNEEVVLLSNAATQLRLANFEEAEILYSDFTKKYPKNAEGYWGLVLARNGIKYEDDINGKKIPTIYATNINSILDDKDYKKAIQFADRETEKYYKSQALKFESIRKEWIEKASKEPPIDIFICYKDSDEEKDIARTDDSYEAQNLYTYLMSKGYSVFYSRESLRDKVSEKYEPYIFNALNTAHVMIIFSSCREYLEAPFVKNEWSRFLKKIKDKQKQENSLILAYDKMKPSEFPKGFSSIQCMDASKKTFYEDLDNHIQKVIKKAKTPVNRIQRIEIKDKKRVGRKKTFEKIEIREIGTYQVGQLSGNEETQLKTAFKFLKRDLFVDAADTFKDILSKNDKCGKALLGKFLAESKIKSSSELYNVISDKTSFDQFELILDYTDKADAVQFLNGLKQACIYNIENLDYQLAIKLAIFIFNYKIEDEKFFKKIKNYLNALVLKKEIVGAQELFESVLRYSSDNIEIYLKELEEFIEILISNQFFEEAEKYYNDYKEIDPNNPKMIWMSILIGLRCNEQSFYKKVSSFSDFDKFENLLECSTKGTERQYYIVKFSEAIITHIEEFSDEDISKIEFVFSQILRYAEDEVLKILIQKFAKACQSKGLFEIAEKYYALLISEDESNHAAYWALLQTKLKVKNNVELIEQPVIITTLPEFHSAIVAAGNDEKSVDRYIELKAKQLHFIEEQKIIQARKRRKRRITKVVCAFLAILCLCVIGITSWRLYYNSQNKLLFSFDIEENGYIVTAGKFYDEKYIRIPETFNGKQVVGIGNDSFKNKSVEIIEIPKTISKIGNYAFYNCINLKEIKLCTSTEIARIKISNSSLNMIGDYAFYNCRNLLNFSISESLTELGEYSFSNCESFSTFDIPSTLIELKNGTFAGAFCKFETELVIPKTINIIGEYVFKDCKNLKTLYVEERDNIPNNWGNNWYDSTQTEVLWSMPLYFNYQNATANMEVEKISVVLGKNYQCPIPTKLGYTFDGWFSQEKGQGKQYTGPDGLSINNWSENVASTAYAKWTPNNNTLVYVSNGATSGEMQSDIIPTNETRQLKHNVYERSGYEFKGWSTMSNGSVQYKDGSDFTMGTDSVYYLYAIWEPKTNQIIFNGNGNDLGEMPNQLIKTDQTEKLNKNLYTKNYYDFIGWATQLDSNVVYQDCEEYKMGPNETYTLYAVWRGKPFTISFIGEDYDLIERTLEVHYKESYNLPIPTKAGYTFDGWYLDSNKIDTNGVYNYTDNIQLEAHWKANLNTIVFDGNGHSLGNVSSITAYTGSSILMPKNEYEKENYIFVGWGTSPSDGVQYKEGDNYIVGTDNIQKFYAVWAIPITTKEQLLAISGTNNIYALNSSIEIDLSSYKSCPIATFSGKIYGQNNLIKLIATNRWASDNQYTRYSMALIRENRGDLFDFTIDINFNVGEDGEVSVSGLVLYNYGEIANVTTTGNIYANNGLDGSAGIASLCVANRNKIRDCINYASLKAYDDIGGLVCQNYGEVSNCINFGEITASVKKAIGNNLFVGGIVANAGEGSIVKNCTAISKITLTGGGYIGGIIGHGSIYDDTTKNSIYVSQCSSFVNIITESFSGDAGGIVGYAYNLTVENSYFIGKILSKNSKAVRIGGIIGYGQSITIKNSFSDNNFTVKNGTSTTSAGSLVGYLQKGQIYNSYGISIMSLASSGTVNSGKLSAKITSSIIENSYAKIYVNLAGNIVNTGTNNEGNDLKHSFNNGIENGFIYSVLNWDRNIWQEEVVDSLYNMVYLPNQGIRIINYQLDGGTNAENNYSGYWIKDANLIVLENPTKPGYSFDGWYDNSEKTEKLENLLNKKDNLVLYAKWTPNKNKLVFNGNKNTSGDMQEQIIETDSTIQLPDNAFVREGYTFQGWAESDSGEIKYQNNSNYTMGPNASYTLYAVWKANQNKLVLNGNNNTAGEMLEQTIETDGTIQLPDNIYVRDGYTFQGWSESVDGEVRYLNGANYKMGPNASYTLYAVWEANVNSIIFNGNGNDYGEMSNQQIRTDQTTKLNTNLYKKDYYEFKGWATELDGPVLYQDGADYTMGPNAIYTLYAIWEKIIRIIDNENDLLILKSDTENEILAYYEITNNFDLKDTNWIPVGTAKKPFRGEINGNNHLIQNLKFTTIEDGILGFIGYNSGEVKNLIIDNISINVSYKGDIYAGGLVANNKGVIEECFANGKISITQTEQYDAKTFVGGLIGYNEAPVNICSSVVEIETTFGYDYTNHPYYVGGLIAYNKGDIEKCSYTGNITLIIKGDPNAIVGGLIACNNSSSIISSYTGGSIDVTITGVVYALNLGGFVGRLEETNVLNCLSICDINVNEEETGHALTQSPVNAGGFVSSVDNSSKASYCYAMGNIVINDGDVIDAGGFSSSCGENNFNNCYAGGDVSLPAGRGDMGGFNAGTTKLTNCYKIKGQKLSGGYHPIDYKDYGTTISLSDMLTKVKNEWDSAVWDFNENFHPVLKGSAFLIYNGLDVENRNLYCEIYPRNTKVILKNNMFEKNLYTFNGWSKSPDAKESEYNEGEEFEIKDLPIYTIYPVWTEIKKEIYSVDDLLEINNDLKNNVEYSRYVLMNDIDLKAQEWTPIGLENHNSFSGQFDGQGFTISNFKITRNLSKIGFFAENTGEIKNLKLSGFKIQFNSLGNETSLNIGGMTATNNGLIQNVFVEGEIFVVNNGDYTSINGTSGMIAAANLGQIKNSKASGKITSSGDVGGFVGTAGGVIINCYSTTSVLAKSDFCATVVAGGFAARLEEGAEIELCYTVGNVEAITSNLGGEAYAAGFIGRSHISKATITNCFTTSNVSADASWISANFKGEAYAEDFCCGLQPGVSSISVYSCKSFLNQKIVQSLNGKKEMKTPSTWSGEYLQPTSLENLQSKDYLKTVLGFGEFVSEDMLLIDGHSVWTFNEGDDNYPSLFWEIK